MGVEKKKSIITRYSIVAFALTLVGLAIIIKASYIMFGERTYWHEVANLFVSKSKPLLPARGNIISADGKLMASSLPEYKIYMDFEAGGPEKDSILLNKMDSICEGLHRIIPGQSASYFKNRIKKGRKKQSRYYLLYPGRITYIQYKEIEKLPLFRMRKYTSGFRAEEYNRRKKPFGSLAASVLGDVFPDPTLGAKNGLELSFDSILRGENGLYHRQKVKNKYLDIIDKEPVDGSDLVITIDVGMQDIAEKALVDKLKEIGGYKGVVILMETTTGDIKAMVNMTQCADGNFYEIQNSCIRDLMEPGSTFKTASMMVALENNVVTVNDSIDTGNGVWMMHGKPMKDHNWRRGGYQWLTVPEILMYSSNVGVSRIIDEHFFKEPQKYVQGLYKLGINANLELPFQGTAQARIRMPNKKNWWKTTLAWMSIGYESQIPPINTVTFYNAIANNGVMLKPRFVKGVMKNGIMVEEFPTEVMKSSICSEHTLKDIKMILHKVVSEGLGKPAGSPQFSVSGKTGTAQISQGAGGYKNGSTSYLLSFCGYFPSENPQYTMLIALQKTGLPASGGLMAGSVFHNIAERIYAKNLSTDLTMAVDTLKNRQKVLKKRYLKDERTAMQKVPNVIGMTLKDATYLLSSRGFRIRTSGIGRVCSQSVPYGNTVQKGATITLQLTAPKDAKIEKEE